MKANLPILLLIFSFTLALPNTALSDSFRCPKSGRIIHDGETQAEILSKCGEPYHVSREESLLRWVNAFEAKQLSVELWTYDFGPNLFTQTLRFEGGRLRSIERGSYGTIR